MFNCFIKISCVGNTSRHLFKFYFRMACRVLLATLSIPLPSAHPEFDRFIETDKSPLEKAQRLAVLLTLPQPPTRASLLKDIVSFNRIIFSL